MKKQYRMSGDTKAAIREKQQELKLEHGNHSTMGQTVDASTIQLYDFISEQLGKPSVGAKDVLDVIDADFVFHHYRPFHNSTDVDAASDESALALLNLANDTEERLEDLRGELANQFGHRVTIPATIKFVVFAVSILDSDNNEEVNKMVNWDYIESQIKPDWDDILHSLFPNMTDAEIEEELSNRFSKD